MKASERDQGLIFDIRKFCEESQNLIRGVKREQFLKDRILQLAAERLIELIGEVSRKLSDETKSRYPDIPFRKIVGMRNILAHDYEKIKPKLLWQVVCDDMPELTRKLK